MTNDIIGFIELLSNLIIIGFGIYFAYSIQRKNQEEKIKKEALRQKILLAVETKIKDDIINQLNKSPHSSVKPVSDQDEFMLAVIKDSPVEMLEEIGLQEFLRLCNMYEVEDLEEIKEEMEANNYFEVCPYIVGIIEKKSRRED